MEASRHCGTGIAPDRDTTDSWRDVDEPCASLAAGAWPGPRTPGQLPAFRYRKEKSRERRTVCWREMDSNFQYAGAVNLVVGPFGWVVLCDRVRSGRGASGTARYQRRGWATLCSARLSNDIRCTSPPCSSLAIRCSLGT